MNSIEATYPAASHVGMLHQSCLFTARPRAPIPTHEDDV